VRGGEAHPEVTERVTRALESFHAMLADDLNVPGGLGAIFELVRALNSAIDAGEIGEPDVPAILEAFESFDRILGVLALRRAEEAAPPVPVGEIEEWIAQRQAARGRRDFATADRLRADLESRGVVLEDTPAGTRWKRR
jgi:cysteinyl-tRNA synthetase